MKRILVAAAVVWGILSGGAITARAQAGPIGGVDMAVVVPTNAFDRFSEKGGVFAPYLGYMFNDYVGVMAQGQVLGAPNKDRPGILDDDATWALAGTAGPRLALPMGPLEVYITGQAGGMTGLAPHSSITDSSWGFSTGGGINVDVTDNFSVGLTGRWNRFYQRVHHVGDVRYASAGISLNLKTAPPPPPPPVAQAAPPPPPPPPPPPMKKKIVLRGVNFDFNKATIRPDARPILDEAIHILKMEGTVDIVAEGHTDSVGTDAYNQKLSIRRANAVKDYLVKGGIPASRIQIEGYGETRPVASNDTAEGRAQNRRVELRVLNQ
jgi:outer membrane protein OmpA-like peptidoglycan-associated protein